jgi:uncharacterized protein with HEPN domain
MRKDDLIRLFHMLDAAREALSFIEGKSRIDLNTNRMLVLSLVKDIEIIGEAAVKISQETVKQLPQIPWAKIIGMRNRLIHAYFEVDLDVLWKTAIEDVPSVIEELEKVIPSEEIR